MSSNQIQDRTQVSIFSNSVQSRNFSRAQQIMQDYASQGAENILWCVLETLKVTTKGETNRNVLAVISFFNENEQGGQNGSEA